MLFIFAGLYCHFYYYNHKKHLQIRMQLVIKFSKFLFEIKENSSNCMSLKKFIVLFMLIVTIRLTIFLISPRYQ